MKKLAVLSVIFLIIAIIFFFSNPFSAPSNNPNIEIVKIDSTSSDAASLELQKAGFIKSFTAFNIAYAIKGKGDIEPGAYYLSKDMSSWQIIDELSDGPDLKEILIKEGMRKEQIGEILKEVLGWSEKERIEWDQLHSHDDYFEGVYFPDTYLIPVTEGPNEVAQRMIANFNEKFTSYQERFSEKNIVWTTGLKLASIIQREAGGSHDMPLIAGILWNRLLEGQKLDIDATIQYAKGKTNGKWWSGVTGSDIRNIDSLYNTYKYKGLPPTPIANPGIAAIEAVLNPEETDCFYYLHDRDREIHCSETYEEHLENIERYLN